MAQYQQQPSDNSGMGVVIGILVAVLIAVGGYFFFQSQNADTGALEPAAGIEAPATTGTPDTGDAAPAPTPAPAP